MCHPRTWRDMQLCFGPVCEGSRDPERGNDLPQPAPDRATVETISRPLIGQSLTILASHWLKLRPRASLAPLLRTHTSTLLGTIDLQFIISF